MDLIRLANSAQSPTSLEIKHLLELLPYRGELRLGGRLVLLDKRAVHLELRFSAGRADGDPGAVLKAVLEQVRPRQVCDALAKSSTSAGSGMKAAFCSRSAVMMAWIFSLPAMPWSLYEACAS